MCGGFGLFVTPEVLEEYFNLTDFAAQLAPPSRYLDSAAEKPAFREAWTRRRCLIPPSGF